MSPRKQPKSFPPLSDTLRRASGRGKYDRGQSAKERWEEQKTVLLEAATAVFARKGYAAATVEAIIADAGMSRRTFYEHFKDLRDALDQVYERASATAFQMVSMLIQQEQDPVLKIRVGIDAWLNAIATFPDAARVVFREVRSAGPEYEARRKLETTRYAAMLFEALAAAHAAGKLKRSPDELSVYALTAAIEAIAMRYLARGRPEDAPQAAPKLHELILGAFS